MVEKPHRLTELLQKLKEVTVGVAHVFEAPIRKAGEITLAASGRLAGVDRATGAAPDASPGSRRDRSRAAPAPRPHTSVTELKSRSHELFEELAARLHEMWRTERLREDGGAERPPKTVEKDQEWIAEHGTDQVDLVRTAYRDLPFDYRWENYASAKVATELVLDEYIAGRNPNTAGFLEGASERVHIAWLDRNHERAPADQKLPYDLLTEEEKEKDRVVVRAALELMQERLTGRAP